MSRSVTSTRPPGMGIGSSNSQLQPVLPVNAGPARGRGTKAVSDVRAPEPDQVAALARDSRGSRSMAGNASAARTARLVSPDCGVLAERPKCDAVVAEVMRVARLYGERPEIYRAVGWRPIW